MISLSICDQRLISRLTMPIQEPFTLAPHADSVGGISCTWKLSWIWNIRNGLKWSQLVTQS